MKYVDPSGNIPLIAVAAATWAVYETYGDARDLIGSISNLKNQGINVDTLTAVGTDLSALFDPTGLGEVIGETYLQRNNIRDDINSGNYLGLADNALFIGIATAGNRGLAKWVQDHHLVPWNNSKFVHQIHGLVVEAGIDLEKYKNNIIRLANHKGRHAPEYHLGVTNILDKYYNKLHKGDFKNANEAFDSALNEIEHDITSGTLKPYNNKDVWKP